MRIKIKGHANRTTAHTGTDVIQAGFRSRQQAHILVRARTRIYIVNSRAIANFGFGGRLSHSGCDHASHANETTRNTDWRKIHILIGHRRNRQAAHCLVVE